MLNGVIYYDGDSVLISDIGPQSADFSDHESTLVCVTTNINTACCRGSDNNDSTTDRAGAVGEWHYPNGTLVPRLYRNRYNVTDFARFGYTHQARLGRQVSSSTPPLGVYTCVVPHLFTGVFYNASITIKGSQKKVRVLTNFVVFN